MIEIDIITPDTTVFKGEANMVKLPGMSGSFGVLKNHAPIISALEKGVVLVRDTNNTDHNFEIKGGVVEVLNNKIIVLAD
jgi:F-type H+-transporting ATPase subunit epsilon